MKRVIDCSVAFKWVVAESDTVKAIRLRDDYRNAALELLAPDLFPTEIANAILIAGWRGRIVAGQGPTLLADVLSTLPLLFPVLPDLLPRAYAIAELARASVYDCLYVALALFSAPLCLMVAYLLLGEVSVHGPTGRGFGSAFSEASRDLR